MNQVFFFFTFPSAFQYPVFLCCLPFAMCIIVLLLWFNLVFVFCRYAVTLVRKVLYKSRLLLSSQHQQCRVHKNGAPPLLSLSVACLKGQYTPPTTTITWIKKESSPPNHFSFMSTGRLRKQTGFSQALFIVLHGYCSSFEVKR